MVCPLLVFFLQLMRAFACAFGRRTAFAAVPEMRAPEHGQELPNTLWSMAKTRTQLPDVLDNLCIEAAQMELSFETHELPNTF